MTRISLAKVAHALIGESLKPGDVAVDATLGNGHDTLFLAHVVGPAGRVYGFDIQDQALDNTRRRLEEHGVAERVTLIQASHADMLEHIPVETHGHIGAIMFNLGYLPGADKRITTQTETTLQAVHVGCALLAAGGIMSLMAYPGHDGGDLESMRLAQCLAELDALSFAWERKESQFPTPKSPVLFVLRKSR
jgi:predicted methyltransferase